MNWGEYREQVAIPKRIENCPLHEAIVEYRFIPKVPSAAVFGLFFREITQEIPGQFEALPIAELPESIRLQDPNLVSKAHYRLSHEHRTVQVGPRVLTFITNYPYEGWDSFSSWAHPIIKRLDGLDSISEVTRIGVRFINRFDHDIWRDTLIQAKFGGETLETEQLATSFLAKTGDYTSRVQVANNQEIRVGGSPTIGSVIDIDTFRQLSVPDLSSAVEDVEAAHQEEKKTFFSLISEEKTALFNPSY